MKPALRLAAAGALALLILSPALAADAGDAARALDKLKGLEGTWILDPAPEGTPDTHVTYKVSGGGSVVIETLFPGTPHEMTTVFFVDGKDLVLVHYCAAGNQPRMKAELGGDPDRLIFRFDGGTNVDPARDMHMHDAEFTFVGPDQLHAEWQAYAGGKKDHRQVFDLKRQKS